MGGVTLVLTAFTLLALIAPSASAQAQVAGSSLPPAGGERARVSLDWAEVHDADIQRCGLAQLRAGTLERLVGEGYAIVEAVDVTGIRVALASSAQGLQIRVQSDGSSGAPRTSLVQVGEPCDATLVLEVIARIVELVAEVNGDLGRARAAAALAATPPAPDPEPAADTRSARWIGSLDLTGRVNASPDGLIGAGLGARVHRASGLEAGARAELTGTTALDVTILEGFLGLTLAHHAERAVLGPYLEIGPILHAGWSDARSVTELDAALGAGAQVSTGPFLAQLLLYGRLRSFQHRVGPEVAHDTGRFGLILRIGAQLSGS